jgi:N,N'-diacetyllegionaminate synthase
MKFKIGKVEFNKDKFVLIAEAGVNHNGSLKIAEQLIKKAKKSGADIIKFQTYKSEKLTIKKAPRFWNWKGEVKKKGSQYDSYKRLDSFEEKEYVKLKKLCDKYKIEFMSTPFDFDAVVMLKKIGVKGFKIASCDITNFPLLKVIAKTNLPIILSTGGSNIKEVAESVKFIEKNGNNKICILHCTLCYPTKIGDANLHSITYLKKKFPNKIIGLSDHTLGVIAPVMSIVLGARVVEKHFTINKKLKKSADHWLSVDPRELEEIRKKGDMALLSLGRENKEVLNCEKLARRNARRSIVAKKNIKINEYFSLDNLDFKRPGTGISPKMITKVLNKKAKKSIKKDEIIKKNHF